eukprot:COSAG01_NODE_4713_length_4797_cov_84.010856_2_plen_71_part_00
MARQVLFNRDKRKPKEKLATNTAWFKKWYGTTGRHGRIMAEINAILNSIPGRDCQKSHARKLVQPISWRP